MITVTLVNPTHSFPSRMRRGSLVYTPQHHNGDSDSGISQSSFSFLLSAVICASPLSPVKMKMLLLAVFAFCISQAVGFGLYGCFERVMYWQAYQMDADSDEKKVGKTCATDPSVHEAKLGKLVQGRCNLRQFLYHISSNEDEKAAIKKLNEKDLAAAEQKSPGVVELAKVLYKGRIGSSYDNAHVYEGVDRGAGHIPKLYTAIGK